MIKDILKLKGVQVMNKNEKKYINGGGICKSLYVAIGIEGDGDLSCVISISGQSLLGTLQNGKCCIN